jgi:hypothetical protein
MKSKILKVLSIITIVPFFVQLIINQRKKSNLRKKVLADGTNDYGGTARNIANSISKSRILYKELITKVHPNNFNDNRIELATELSSKITKAKRNYEELEKLKIEVDEFIKTKE